MQSDFKNTLCEINVVLIAEASMQVHTGAAGNLPDAAAEAGARRVLHLAQVHTLSPPRLNNL